MCTQLVMKLIPICKTTLRRWQSLAILVVSLCTIASAEAAPEATLISYWNSSDASSQDAVDHSQWQTLLDRYLDTAHQSGINRFNYAAVSADDIKLLDQYLAYLQNLDPRKLNRAQQFAYWVNLYNAKTIELVTRAVQTRGITTIRQIRSNYLWPGPWRMKTLEVAGKDLSLDNIEHGILRPIWKDHRIHYAVNCASIGCPNLLPTAFTALNSEGLLAIAEKDFLSHPRAATVNGNKLVLSKLFSWYGSDFAADTEKLVGYVGQFVNLEMAVGEYDVSYYYDWKLNSQDSLSSKTSD